MKKISFFTPTYNRGYILKNLYNSLLRQTNKDFCWIIVDDGSTDNTEELVRKWLFENNIEIIFRRQKNQGKMAAHNYGVKLSNTDLFVCIDSDDFVVDNFVEIIISKQNYLSQNKIAGIIAYRGKSKDEPIGTEFNLDLKTSTLSCIYNQGFIGDTTLVFKTDVIKKYPFPIIEGEKFITESFVYDQIDKDYRYVLLPKVLTICEYRNDGLTLNGMKLVFNNPAGWAARSIQQGNSESEIIKRMKHYIWANSYQFMSKWKKLPIIPEKN